MQYGRKERDDGAGPGPAWSFFAGRARRFLAALALLGAVVAAALPAYADADASVTVTVIHARKGQPFLHEALRPLWETLQKTFGNKFDSYDQVSTETRTVAVDQRFDVRMPNGDSFAAIYGGITPEKGLLRISLEYGDFRTKVRIHDGGMFFQAGRAWKDGTLVVAIKASIPK